MNRSKDTCDQWVKLTKGGVEVEAVPRISELMKVKSHNDGIKFELGLKS